MSPTGRRLLCAIQPRAKGGREWVYQRDLPDAHGDFTAEPATDTVSARATPLGDLLEPLTLDPLTVVDDARFLELLGKERNLPTEIASAIPGLY